MSNIRVTALYKFVSFDDPEALRAPLFERLEALGIKGTILLATEGVNGTIAGTRAGIDSALGRIKATLGIDDLEYKELSALEPGKGQVVVDIAAAGVNFPDGLLVQGLYQMKPERPFIPGNEVAGTISAIGEGVQGWQVGQRVIALCMLGGYAEQVVVPQTHILPLPEQIPFEEAAALVTAHATAHHALKQRANIQPGETLVVTGAAGGTGLAAVQIGKELGATVIAVCSTAEKLATAKENGADILINYTEENLKDAIKQAL